MFGIVTQNILLAGDMRWNSGNFEGQESESNHSEREKPTVLVVDDQELIVDTITEILELYGFRAFAAYGGRPALELAAKIQPDYLLTDVLMPGMNGMELAIAIKEVLPGTRIILFSGQTGVSSILLDGRQRGHEFEMIAKPIHPEKLIEVLKNMK